MKKIIFILSLYYCIFGAYKFIVKNSVYAYNAENTYFGDTRTTLTYFGDIIQPEFVISSGRQVEFTFGIGLFIPFDQESKIKEYFPYIQTKLKFNNMFLNLGSLDNNHNYPTTIINRLIKTVPEIRIINDNRYKITRGKYEYGIQLKWLNKIFDGEIYMNWQLKDTDNHKERFDAGFINTSYLSIFPIYLGLHYWHNGGHEHLHMISITENYVLAFGLRNKTFNILYHGSYFLPDRDGNSDLNFYGQGIYLDYLINIGILSLQPVFWISDTYLNKEHKYFSAEGDPFYSCPLYTGLNIILNIPIDKDFKLTLLFKNGTFHSNINRKYSFKMIRYDQKINFDFQYKF